MCAMVAVREYNFIVNQRDVGRTLHAAKRGDRLCGCCTWMYSARHRSIRGMQREGKVIDLIVCGDKVWQCVAIGKSAVCLVLGHDTPHVGVLVPL